MPGQDGTGPEGRGPLTGGGLGNCAPTQEGTVWNRIGRRLGGLGRGRRAGGLGRGGRGNGRRGA